MARIELDKVSLTFHVRQAAKLTLKEYLVKRMFLRSVNPLMEVRALQEVSLEVKQGERVGIIGRNGAGKSTLLKLLAGIYPPTSGRRVVEGKISSLFDLTLGFETEATGWENIAYRSYLQGETPRTVRARVQEIADFSELGRFLDMPVRFYSAGMLVRLAFSIATAIEPEVLLIDEALSAGDLAFKHKCHKRLHDMLSKAHLGVVVSHDLGTLAELCERLIWMDQGRIRMVGRPAEVIDAYEQMNKPKPNQAA